MAKRSIAMAGVVVAFVLLPAVAFAQAMLSGTIKDTSGAVLPGVTVEATSPVLLEKVRSAVADGSGQYRIAELLPGTYTVTFTLAGFTTVQRQEVQLSGVGVTTINVEMRVGALEETITVTGETPVVDIQSARRGQVLGDEVIKALPATRGYNAIVFLVPSVTGGSNQIDLSPAMRIFYSHGGRGNEGRVQVDGLNVGAAFNGGGVSGYIMDTANAQELNLTLSGGLGEAEVGGTNVNIIPRTGGNSFAGQIFGSTAGEWSQGSNIDDRLRNFGIQEPAAIYKNWDLSGSVGGPIMRDRVWFHANFRDFGQHDDILGMYGNKNAGDPTKWGYERDDSLKARNAVARTITAVRLTAQITPRNKIGLFFDNQLACDGSAMTTDATTCRPAGNGWVANGTPTVAPEAASGAQGQAGGAFGFADSFQRVTQATYTSPVTSKLLLEAGWSTYVSRWGWMEPPGAIRDLVQVQEQASLNGAPANLTYRALDWNFNNWQSPTVWRASASYVTGAHSMKSWDDANRNFVPDCDLMNPALNGECGVWQSPTFGNPLAPVTINPDILHGWGVRPYDWQFGVSMQHEVLPRTSVEVGYHRRWFGNFTVTDNLAVGPQDFDQFTVLAPQHSALPGGGGYPVTYYDPRTLATDNYVTFEEDYGPSRTAYWHGIDINLNTRMQNGLTFQGGTSTGRGVQDWCEIGAALPELFNTGLVPGAGRRQTGACKVTESWLTQFRGFVGYVIPRVDVQVSAGVQLKPGTLGIGGNDSATNGNSLRADVPTPNAVIRQSLGRVPTGGLATGNTTLDALLPGELYGDRVNQVDLRVGKILRIGRTRTLVGFDLYNLFNDNPGLTYNLAYAANWPRPTTVLLPRFVRFNATVDF